MLVAVCIGWGIAQVAWRNAIVMNGYHVGERLASVQTAQTRVDWLATEVARLESPIHLAEVAAQQKLGLVAWSVLPSSPAAPAQQRLQLATAQEGASND
jgi:hypothetical protein